MTKEKEIQKRNVLEAHRQFLLLGRGRVDREFVNDLVAMSMGSGCENIRDTFYPGWTDEEFIELLKAYRDLVLDVVSQLLTNRN